MPRLELALAGLAVLAAATAAPAPQGLGVVQAYNTDDLRAYDEAGQPIKDRIKKADLPRGVPIARMGRGGTVGIEYGGRIIYLRGIDVVTSNASAPCAQAAPATRQGGQVYGGTTMAIGSGRTRDCQAAGAK